MASRPPWPDNSAAPVTGAAPPAAALAQLEELVRVIRSTPAIDNHAQPLLPREGLGRRSLLSVVTDAEGEVAQASSKTLARHHAVHQLAAALRCDPSWDAVRAAVETKRLDAAEWHRWVDTCLAGTETILLVDEAADSRDPAHKRSWHDDFVRSPCRRIFPIETIAAAIIDGHAQGYNSPDRDSSCGRRRHETTDDVFDRMLEEFDMQVKQAIENPDIVAFKSAISHGTGLGIHKVVDIAAARESFEDILENYGILGRFTDLNHEGLNDLFVHHTAVLIRECSNHFRKPIQFHAGIGGNGTNLSTVNPGLLQDFMRAYPVVPMVLLRASYPHMREAGYLASVYANVYVDIGKVFPMISPDGQEAVLKEVLELCPWSKVLWSSGGHVFPESYLLANLQGREALESVLCDMVRKGRLDVKKALELTKDVLFRNSNELYRLELNIHGRSNDGDDAETDSDNESTEEDTDSDDD